MEERCHQHRKLPLGNVASLVSVVYRCSSFGCVGATEEVELDKENKTWNKILQIRALFISLI